MPYPGLAPGLIRSGASRCAFAVTGVQFVDDVHPFDNFAERSESISIEPRVVA